MLEETVPAVEVPKVDYKLLRTFVNVHYAPDSTDTYLFPLPLLCSACCQRVFHQMYDAPKEEKEKQYRR